MNQLTEVGDWRKISDLGSGAFGVVSLWKNITTEDCIAVKLCKFLSPESLSMRQRQRWCEEVSRMALIDHPNIVRHKPLPLELEAALKRCNPTGLPSLSMEYCCLGSLRRQLNMPHNLAGLPETQLRVALKDIAEGAAYLHTLGVTHRDIKPDNVVLQLCPERKDEIVYKLIDLGYAKELGDSVVSFVGTSHYLAPEIIRGDSYGPQVDYWSMGVLCYELTTGTLPFLPDLSPIERFSKLQEKSDDDICAYTSYSGTVVFSSEIRPECRVGSTLKRHLSIWLRSALRLDPNRRGRYISTQEENIGAVGVAKQVDKIQSMLFKNLIQTVSKPVVKLFYANKMELYEYEIDDVTLMGTVREWVGRDVMATKREDVFLMFYDTNNHSVCLQLTDDRAPLLSILPRNQDSDSTVVKVLALRRDVPILQVVAPVTFSRTVREAMTSAKTFNLKYARTLCSQTVYLVTLEKDISEMYRACCQWDIEHGTPQAVKQLHVAVKRVDEYTDSLASRMEYCSRSVMDETMKTKYNHDQLEYFQRLVECVLRAQQWRHQLKQRALTLNGWARSLRQQAELIATTTLRRYTLDDLYKDAITLPQKKDIKLLSHISEIISKVIKKKHELVNDVEFKKYASATCKLHRCISNLIDWTLKLENYLKTTTIALQTAVENHMREPQIDQIPEPR